MADVGVHEGGAATCGTAANPIIVGPGGGTAGGTMMFSPASCTVLRGQTVTWSWGSTPHSVSSDPGAPVTFDSGIFTGTLPHTFTFTIPTGMASGTVIHYHCNVHGVVSGGVCSGMCATLTVQ